MTSHLIGNFTLFVRGSVLGGTKARNLEQRSTVTESPLVDLYENVIECRGVSPKKYKLNYYNSIFWNIFV